MASSSTNKNYRALVFGASGITGWAIMNNALTYPSPNTFERIIGLTNRPLSTADSCLPQDPRIELYSGIDLSKKDTLVQMLQQVREIEKITHVYFAAYTAHSSDYQVLKRANVEILTNAVEAIENLCPKLLFFTLQTGGKAYGIEFVSEFGPLKVPFKETDPRIPEPYASNIFYYPQYDYLHQKTSSSSCTFKFCEIRPDVIVGFVPQNNFMNLAQALGLFLSFYKSVYGSGANVPFPGPKFFTDKAGREGEQENTAWTAKRCDTSQDILAKFHLYASIMKPEAVHTRAFNVADGVPEVVSWETAWPRICTWFGLKGVPPDGTMESFATWMRERKDQLGKWEEEMGLKKGALEGTG